jgi:hypothetical protein
MVSCTSWYHEYMTQQDIPTLRLLNQAISSASQKDLKALTDYMGALQAQDYYGSLWALGLRTGYTEQAIIQAVAERDIIRTWPQRGTLHFVSAADAKWLVGLSADRLLKGATTRRTQLGIDEAMLDLSKRALLAALKNDQQLTRPEVMTVLNEAGISTDGGRGYHIVWYLSQTGFTYIGPMRAKQQTLGLLDELIPKPKTMPRNTAIAELAKRYFVSHGPATIQDFMWWAGLTSKDAKAGLAANQTVLQVETVAGKEYWLPKHIPLDIDTNRAFLLPGFDEYLLGYKDRSAVLDPGHVNKVIPGSNGVFSPTIIIRGQVVGTWKRTVKKDHVLLELTPFKPLTKADQKLIQKPAEAYGSFVNLPPKLQLQS